MEFTHLHLHSEFSKFDGFGTAEMYAERMKELGMKAMAITDHGTMRGAYEHWKAFSAHGLKTIFGVELYVSDDPRRKGLTEEEKELAIVGCANKAEEKEGSWVEWQSSLCRLNSSS